MAAFPNESAIECLSNLTKFLPTVTLKMEFSFYEDWFCAFQAIISLAPIGSVIVACFLGVFVYFMYLGYKLFKRILSLAISKSKRPSTKISEIELLHGIDEVDDKSILRLSDSGYGLDSPSPSSRISSFGESPAGSASAPINSSPISDGDNSNAIHIGEMMDNTDVSAVFSLGSSFVTTEDNMTSSLYHVNKFTRWRKLIVEGEELKKSYSKAHAQLKYDL